jgi:hypothetical protein
VTGHVSSLGRICYAGLGLARRGDPRGLYVEDTFSQRTPLVPEAEMRMTPGRGKREGGKVDGEGATSRSRSRRNRSTVGACSTGPLGCLVQGGVETTLGGERVRLYSGMDCDGVRWTYESRLPECLTHSDPRPGAL